jgi:hypothetical protein
VAGGGVVEDDVGFGVGMGAEVCGEVGEEGVGVGGIVGAGRAVEAVVAEFVRARGMGGEGRAFGRVGGCAGDVEVAEQAVGLGREPGGVAGFEDGGGGVELAEGGEEFVGEASVELEGGRELDEEWAEFVAEGGDLVEEGLEEGAGVDELGFVGDGARDFYGEAEVGGGGEGPALPGFAQVGAMETGVDFYAVEHGGVAVEVGGGVGKVVGVLFGERPTSGADANVHAGGWMRG